MISGQNPQARAGDRVAQRLGGRARRRFVLIADENQRRQAQATCRLGQVGRGDRLGGACI
jgi:hypothetical protein